MVLSWKSQFSGKVGSEWRWEGSVYMRGVEINNLLGFANLIHKL